jgi:hypothetical protein
MFHGGDTDIAGGECRGECGITNILRLRPYFYRWIKIDTSKNDTGIDGRGS